MLRFVFSATHALFAAYAGKVQRPIRFCPERDKSQREQQQFASTAVIQWAKDAEPSIIYVFTHSSHFLNAATLAILRGEVKHTSLSAVYLYQSEGVTYEHELTFDDMGRCEPWPPGFLLEHTEACRDICRLQRDKINAKKAEKRDLLVRRGFAPED